MGTAATVGEQAQLRVKDRDAFGAQGGIGGCRMAWRQNNANY
jgi:hypothetical protein